MKILGVFIDALNQCFISKTDTPFLYELSNKGENIIPLESVLGYSTAIDATIFTGTYPDTHGIWIEYYYNSHYSPYSRIPIIKLSRPIDYIPIQIFRSGINFLLSKFVYQHYAKKFGYHELAPYNIPYRIITYFDVTTFRNFTEPKAFPVPSLVDILIENGLSFYYFTHIDKITLQNALSSDVSVFYSSEADLAGHIFGVGSKQHRNALRKIDKKIELLVNKYREKFRDNFVVLVFSDHGMANVDTKISTLPWIKDQDLGNKYLVAIESTMMRFWYFDEEYKEKIREKLNTLEYGHLLSIKEKKKLRVYFPDNKYGEDIFLIDQGYVLYPSFKSWSIPKAMHGYHPNLKEQLGVVISPIISDVKAASVVDIMPTLLKLLDLEIPKTVEGRPLVI
ncbi:MAG TPA: hypothetical protein DEA61_07325 [Caldanaerobacter subterraneus]|uniref:Alkaline phosphatase family protein n=1 Tax=Caldanaerobacter subterraneus TaxID=911092 RepID=A0A357VMY4_9THEO|nr:alkaline phosphatase family protein [Caldanaerobacter subterraneus]HBT49622.1 hypothetical protein [Caldanaerobacter subterraneus]